MMSLEELKKELPIGTLIVNRRHPNCTLQITLILNHYFVGDDLWTYAICIDREYVNVVQWRESFPLHDVEGWINRINKNKWKRIKPRDSNA